MLLGNGHGTFVPKAEAAYPILDSYGGSVALGDFNGDGKLDIAALNVASNKVGVLSGKAMGLSPPRWTTPPRADGRGAR